MPREPEKILISATDNLIILRIFCADAHADPDRRGAYLQRVPGRAPELILDGMATEAEQREAEARCLRELGRGARRRPAEHFEARSALRPTPPPQPIRPTPWTGERPSRQTPRRPPR